MKLLLLLLLPLCVSSFFALVNIEEKGTFECSCTASNGSATTVKASATTAKTTTTAPVASSTCVNMNGDEQCDELVAYGFCTSHYSFQEIKWSCAKACGLCGKKADPCIDVHVRCAEMKANGMLNMMTPMEAEKVCAMTGGFCSHPN